MAGNPIEDFDYDPYCQRCDNSGFIIVCVDDMCRGMYDGEGYAPCGRDDDTSCIRVCPDCKGEFA